MKKALYLFLTIFLGNIVNAMEQPVSPLMSLPTEIITIIASHLIDEKKFNNPETCADLDKSIEDLNNAKLVCKEFNDIINMVINHKPHQKFSLKENYLLKKILIKNFAYSADQLTFMNDDSKSTKEIIDEILKIKDRYGSTPLLRASANGYLEVVKLLLDHGADIDIQDTPSDQDYLEIVRLLLATANITTYYRDTPLHWASFNGHTEVVKLLLANGADIDIKDNNGHTPLHLALKKGHVEILQLLEKAAEEKKTKEKNAKDQYNAAINVLSQKNNIGSKKTLWKHNLPTVIQNNYLIPHGDDHHAHLDENLVKVGQEEVKPFEKETTHTGFDSINNEKTKSRTWQFNPFKSKYTVLSLALPAIGYWIYQRFNY
ncbi:MAG: ankyrin repeat domain-containing protein [Candidatus Babeliales bacterium]